jgi:CRP/FNR family transcriptional regulator, cyclic AMP receptor protein
VSTIRELLERSFLRGVRAETLDLIARGARRVALPAGAILHPPGGAPAFAIVESGLIRLGLTAPDGRQIAARYARSGDEIGVMFLFKRRRPMTVQTLTAATAWQLDLEALRQLATRDAEIGWRLAAHLASLLEEAAEELTNALFGTMRQRVARHLLDLSTTSGPDAALAVRFSHQQIAEGLGTAREVVSRALRALQSEGLVRAGRAGIEILDTEGLFAAGHPAV